MEVGDQHRSRCVGVQAVAYQALRALITSN
jgi:hypothetical protein